MSDTFTFDPRTPMASADAAGSGSDELYPEGIPERAREYRRKWWFVRNAEMLVYPGSTPMTRDIGPTAPVFAYDIAWLYEMWSRIYYLSGASRSSVPSWPGCVSVSAEPQDAWRDLKAAVGTDPDGKTSHRIDFPTGTIPWEIVDAAVDMCLAVIAGGCAVDGMPPETWSLGTGTAEGTRTTTYTDGTRADSVSGLSYVPMACPSQPPYRLTSSAVLEGMKRTTAVTFRGDRDPAESGEPECAFDACVPDHLMWVGDGAVGRTRCVYPNVTGGNEYLSYRASLCDGMLPYLTCYAPDYVVIDPADRSRMDVKAYVAAMAGSVTPSAGCVAYDNPGTYPAKYMSAYVPTGYGSGSRNWWKEKGIPDASPWPDPVKTLVNGAHVPPAGPLDLVLSESDAYGAPFEFESGDTRARRPSVRCSLRHPPVMAMYLRFLADTLKSLGTTFRYSAARARTTVLLSSSCKVSVETTTEGTNGTAVSSKGSEHTVSGGVVSTRRIGDDGNLWVCTVGVPAASDFARPVSPYGISVTGYGKDGARSGSYVHTENYSDGSTWRQTVANLFEWSLSRCSVTGSVVASSTPYSAAGRVTVRNHEWLGDWSDEYSDVWEASDSSSGDCGVPYVPDELVPFVKDAAAYLCVESGTDAMGRTTNTSSGRSGSGSYSRSSEVSQYRRRTTREFVRVASGAGMELSFDAVSRIPGSQVMFGGVPYFQMFSDGHDGHFTKTYSDGGSTTSASDTYSTCPELTVRPSNPVAFVRWDPAVVLGFSEDCPCFVPDGSSS